MSCLNKRTGKSIQYSEKSPRTDKHRPERCKNKEIALNSGHNRWQTTARNLNKSEFWMPDASSAVALLFIG